jgi:hypothetical protein
MASSSIPGNLSFSSDLVFSSFIALVDLGLVGKRVDDGAVRDHMTFGLKLDACQTPTNVLFESALPPAKCATRVVI